MQMKMHKVVMLSFTLLLPLTVTAQTQWAWPDKPSNLQVFPKDWTGQRLRGEMVEFTRALGVRCSFCHKGVEGQPLSTYDFASDDNPNKNRAREMVRMVADIKPHLEKVQTTGEKPVNVWCYTCHRGRPRPTTLIEELNEQYSRMELKGPWMIMPI